VNLKTMKMKMRDRPKYVIKWINFDICAPFWIVDQGRAVISSCQAGPFVAIGVNVMGACMGLVGRRGGGWMTVEVYGQFTTSDSAGQ
jgi:hypothetical protein